MPIGDLGLTGVIGGVLQEKPKIPEFTPVDAQAEQRKAISGNMSSIPGLEQMASQLNDFYSGEMTKNLESLNPGYGALRSKQLGVINDELSGKMPGLDDWVKRRGAETAADTGTSGSFALGQELNIGFQARNQLINQGLSAGDRWTATATKPALFDVSSMFVDPKTQIGLAESERNAKFQRDYVSNQNDAAHSFGTIVGQSLIKSDAEMNQVISSL